MLLVARFGADLLGRYSSWFYLGTLALLVGVLILANPVNGARRWFDFGGFQLQPSEFAKLAIILILARLFARRHQNTNKLSVLLLSGFYTALMAGLIVIQPDLGTTVIIIGIWAGLLLLSRLPKRLLLASLAAISLVIWLVFPLLAQYQRARLEAFLNPLQDPVGINYNSRQAMIAIGSGELLGRGLEAGSQSQLLFLPAKHTDFIFATIAEKLGFLGAGLVIVSLAILVLSIFRLALRVDSHFASFAIAGVGLLIGLESVINIGMNLGLLPVTGIPLPFLSYGGSHTLTLFIGLGMVLALSRQSKPLQFY